MRDGLAMRAADGDEERAVAGGPHRSPPNARKVLHPWPPRRLLRDDHGHAIALAELRGDPPVGVCEMCVNQVESEITPQRVDQRCNAQIVRPAFLAVQHPSGRYQHSRMKDLYIPIPAVTLDAAKA